MSMRVENHPVLGELSKRKQISIYFNDQVIQAYEGDTIASAMMAQGIYTLRNHEESGAGRGIYCNIGHCYECRVQTNKKKIVRACITPIYEGMEIYSLSKSEQMSKDE